MCGIFCSRSLLFLIALAIVTGWVRADDIDGDGDVDRDDLAALMFPWPAAGPDLDGDGLITVLDGTILVSACSRLVCATENDPLVIILTQPANGTITNQESLAITGRVDRTVASLDINGVPAVINSFDFSLDALSLTEGTNQIVATAITNSGQTGTASISVRRDTQAPLVVIESPHDGDRLIIDDIVVAGTVNDIIPGVTVNSDDVSVMVNGMPTTVANRTFFLDEFLLEPGANTLTVTAVDVAGNTGSASIRVTLEDDLAGVRLEIVSGNGQEASTGSTLPQSLVVAVTDPEGLSIAGRPVVFSVSRGDGLLDDPLDNLTTRTLLSDGNGHASLDFTLGSRTGQGFHRVRVTTPGSIAFAEFCASATAGMPTKVVKAGMNPARAVIGQAMNEALAVNITDSDGNPVAGVDVTWQSEVGGGHFSGAESAVTTTDMDGVAHIFWTPGPDPGTANNRLSATFEGNPGSPVIFTLSGVQPGDGQTTISGIVQNSAGQPIEGAEVVLEGTPITGFTGADGAFRLEDVTPGGHRVGIRGSTANRAGTNQFYPDIDYAVTAISGIDNPLDQIVILPFLDMAGAKLVGGDEDATLEMAGVPGFGITVAANSVILPDGSSGTILMSSSQVKFDKVPMEPPMGSTPLVVGTLQPAGIRFDPPARVSYPNTKGLAPGDVADIFAFHHDIGQFVNVGPGTVSQDGSVVVSDAGFGIVQSGWHCLIESPGPKARCANGCKGRVRWRIPGRPLQHSGPVVLGPNESAMVEAIFRPPGGVFNGAWSSNGSMVSLQACSTPSPSPWFTRICITAGSGTGNETLLTPTYEFTNPDPDITCQLQVQVRVIDVDLVIFDGQSGIEVGDPFEESIGAFTVANLNDTDGDGITDKNDNNVAGGGNGRDEVDLMKLILRKPQPDNGGEVRLFLSGKIRLWDRETKDTEVTTRRFPTSDLPKTLWVEAWDVSRGVRDITIEMNYMGIVDKVSATAVWAEQTNFGNMGTNLSPDANQALKDLFQLVGGQLGAGHVSPQTNNVMEMEFTVKPDGIGNEPGIVFDISRRFESVEWVYNNALPTPGAVNSFPTTEEEPNDDSNDIDKDNVPTRNHIYVLDAPGFDNDQAIADRYVLRANFDEFVRVKVNGGIFANQNGLVEGSRCSDYQPWRTRMDVVEDTGTGLWMRNNAIPGENEIVVTHKPLGTAPTGIVGEGMK